MPRIYITKADQRLGPFSPEDVLTLVQNEHFTWDNLAWREGFDDWAPLRQVLEGIAAEAPDATRSLSAEEPEPSFFRELFLAFAYPFRGSSAWMILIFGTILVMMMTVVQFAYLFGLFATIFLTGYCIAFLFKIIRETVAGEQEVAEFPGLQDVWDDVLRPFAQFIFAFVACVLPWILVAGFFHGGAEEGSWVPLAVLAAGLFYLPMVLLATVIFNSVLTALNPVLVIPAISRIFLRYLIIAILLGGTIIGRELLAEFLDQHFTWIVAMPMVSFVTFYMGIIQARILGLIYRTSSERIGWFNR